MIKNASQGPESLSSRVSHDKHMGLFFAPRSIAVATLLSLGACGGGGGDDSSDSATPAPVSPGPQKAQAHIELGAISGGNVSFMTLGGKVLEDGIISGNDGSIEYHPSKIIASLGANDEWVVVRIREGVDMDANDDGITDSTPITIQGSFSVIIPRSAIEKGESFIANPRAGFITEKLINRGGTITQDILDNAAREMGASDSDNNGVVNYRDILFTSMKNVSDFSRVVPLSSGYISSVHSDDTQAKVQSIINISLTENHLSTTILPDQKNPNSHNPALEIKSTANGGKILFTLDNSSPHPNNPNTQTASGTITIPAQNAVLYYREMFQIDGKDVLGKVQRFDLSMDWIELAQEKQTYNPHGKSEITTNQYPYKDTSYTITTESGVLNPGYTYPKHVGCYIGNTKTDGCNLGPYLAYSPAHESRIITMIHSEAKAYIDTLGSNPKPPDPDTPPITKEESHEILKNGILYKTSKYWLYNDWTIGTDGKRTYPVKLSGEYQKKDGTKVAIDGGTILQASEKDTKNIALEEKIKSLIDQDINSGNSQYRQNEERLYQENPAYYGGWYKIYYYWNQNGNADYPMKIVGTYAIQNQGRQPNIEYTAYSDSEKNTITASLIADIQSKIQAGYNMNPPPTYPQGYVIDSGFINYKNGYGYNLFTTMNVNGNADYPATVYARYTSPSGGGYTQTLTAHNTSELSQVQNERANDAKARIDLELQSDKYPAGYTEQVTYRRGYANGSFESRFQYSYNPGQDYPGYVDVYYTRGDGYTGKLTMQAENANQKNSYVPLLEEQAKLEIDNYPLYSPNTTNSTGSIPYGSRGSNYEIFAKYNRVGNGYNYPALVWIQYRSGKNGQLLDTRNTYGITEARDSEEKERIKSQLESWVKGQMLAANGDINTQYATETTREKILRFLPFGTAHAVTNSTITVKKGAEYFGKVTPYMDPNYSVVQDFMAGVGKQTYLYQKGGNKPGMSGENMDAIKSNVNIKRLSLEYSQIQYEILARVLSTNRLLCTGAGTTIETCISEKNISFPSPINTGDDIRFKMADSLLGWYGSGKADRAFSEMYKYPANFIVMFALIYEEQSHLSPPFIEDTATRIISIFKGGSQSLGLSQITTPVSKSDQINFGYKSYSIEEILDTTTHIGIMNERIETIKKKLREHGLPETSEMIGRVWNGGYNCIAGTCSNHAIDYGKRIQDYANALDLLLKK